MTGAVVDIGPVRQWSYHDGHGSRTNGTQTRANGKRETVRPVAVVAFPRVNKDRFGRCAAERACRSSLSRLDDGRELVVSAAYYLSTGPARMRWCLYAPFERFRKPFPEIDIKRAFPPSVPVGRFVHFGARRPATTGAYYAQRKSDTSPARNKRRNKRRRVRARSFRAIVLGLLSRGRLEP